MTERPEPLRTLDGLMAAATIAHERIADLHARAAGRRSLRLLQESADIVFRQMTALTSEVRLAERDWAEQELLDPPRAADTLRRIEAQMAGIRVEFERLLSRQVAIARGLESDR